MAELKQGKDYDPNEGNKKKVKAKPNNTSKNPPTKKVIIAMGSVLGVILLIVGIAYAFDKKGSDAGGTETEDGGGFFSGIFGSKDNPDDIPDDFGFTDEDGFTDLGDNLFEYTDEEYQMLLDAGYTTDEIDTFEMNFEDAYTKVAEYEEHKKSIIYENFPELKEEAMEKGSEEYNKILNKTYLGLKPFTLKADKDGSTFLVSSLVKETVPYEKMGSRGHQNFVRLSSYTYGSLFTEVTPQLYLQMRDKGSIVAEYTVYKDLNGKEIIADINLEIVDYNPN